MSQHGPDEAQPLIRALPGRPSRIFAVGDIHGCVKEAEALLQHLRSVEGLGRNDLLVFIGDYIDRGPHSSEVLSLMIDLRRALPQAVFLRGNHEDMLLDYLGLGGSSGEMYLENGGAECLKSYGLHPFTPRDDIIAALPPEHLAFLKGLELGASLAEFVFVHAGVDPARKLGEQLRRDLLWIRGDFLHHEHTLGKTVVFGHTPFEDLAIHLPFKIGIDTGLVFGNKLSAVELVHGRLFQVARGETGVLTYELRSRLGG